MSKKCEIVVISDKAYNAIIRESFSKHPVETGGILLGHILEGGLWVVMEMVPPGFNSTHQPAFFEYDLDFVNYLGTSVANQYKQPLQVLGLWHRHPGSMDYFSSTDDGTNSEFASRNPYGTISGLVNIDPSFRLTMYHLDHNDGVRPRNIAYSTVDVEVGDDLIPERFFELRYIDSERSELHPTPSHANTHIVQTRNVPKSMRNDGDEYPSEKSESAEKMCQQSNKYSNNGRRLSRKTIYMLAAIAIFIAGIVVGGVATPIVYKWLESKEATVAYDKVDKTPPADSQDDTDINHNDDSDNTDSGSDINSGEPDESNTPNNPTESKEPKNSTDTDPESEPQQTIPSENNENRHQ